MRRMLTYISLVVATLLLSCNGENGQYPTHGKVSIAYLQSIATERSIPITQDVYIEGRVVANDKLCEIEQGAVIADESGGIEIAIDTNKTATQFPVSARVVVYCSGLTIGDYGGRLTLGAKPAGRYTVDRISSKDISRYFFVDKSAPKAIEPTRLNINEIAEEHIGNYIRLDDVTFSSQAGMSWCDKEPASGEYITTERTLHDRKGNALAVRTIAECLYRSEKIPSGYGVVCGIVEYFNGNYSLRIVNHQILF